MVLISFHFIEFITIKREPNIISSGDYTFENIFFARYVYRYLLHWRLEIFWFELAMITTSLKIGIFHTTRTHVQITRVSPKSFRHLCRMHGYNTRTHVQIMMVSPKTSLCRNRTWLLVTISFCAWCSDNTWVLMLGSLCSCLYHSSYLVCQYLCHAGDI